MIEKNTNFRRTGTIEKHIPIVTDQSCEKITFENTRRVFF